MSFQNNGIWLTNSSGSLANGEMCYDSTTRIDQKRSHQWFTGPSEQELFTNKKQAVESTREVTEPVTVDGFWRDGSNSQSEGQTGDRLFAPKPVRLEDPLSLNTGLRKVKVNEVTIPDNCFPEFMGNTIFQRSGSNMYSEPTNNTDANFMLNNQYYNGIDNNLLSIGFNGGNYSSTHTVQYEKEASSNFVAISPNYGSKGHDNFFAVDPFSNRLNETFMTAGSTYNNNNNIQHDAPIVSLGSLYNKENSGLLSMVANSKNGEEATISFGGVEDSHEERDLSGRLISNYDLLANQSTGQNESALQLSANVVTAATSKTDGAQIKNKEQKTKKGLSNNFPTNVKSLLSTGILDGVPVKYVSWSREKNLRGVVKGTGYLCSCQDCKLTKAINAYEFERHAGCKTKHPNNHIYFENGKTIYAVVQELKSTPQERLFEVMQNITGSPIDQKNFDTWKSSYKAASRELQRIYGKDEMVVQS
ncbi:hypothetical protein ABFS83_05G106300 [Erythranthe nasuta]